MVPQTSRSLGVGSPVALYTATCHPPLVSIPSASASWVLALPPPYSLARRTRNPYTTSWRPLAHDPPSRRTVDREPRGRWVTRTSTLSVWRRRFQESRAYPAACERLTERRSATPPRLRDVTPNAGVALNPSDPMKQAT